MTKLLTHSGQVVDLGAGLDVSTIRVEDIAVSLSRQPRFNGHTRRLYSVAEHSVRAAWQALTDFPNDPGFSIMMLGHDMHEFATGDIPRPLLLALGREVREKIEREQRRLDAVIFRALDLSEVFEAYRDDPRVAEYDGRMLATEIRDLMPDISALWTPILEPFRAPISLRHDEPLFWRIVFLGELERLKQQYRYQGRAKPRAGSSS